MISVADYVVKYLESIGVKHNFSLVGGGSMYLNNSFGKSKLIKNTYCLHEQACAIASDGANQYSNSLSSVVTVTTGPGGTNAITGVMASWIDSIPMLVISGQVNTKDFFGTKGSRQKGMQGVDITEIAKNFTKYAVTVTYKESIRYHLEKAVHLATTGRKGPVWIDIPLDISNQMIDENDLARFEPDERKLDNSLLHDGIQKLTDLMSEAKKPVILAGNGIRLSGGLGLFKEIVEKLKIPVITTWKALDYFEEDYKYSVGRSGIIGQRGANLIQQNCDLLICIGARLDAGQIGYNINNFAPDARKVLVDIDISETKSIGATLTFNCDALDFLEAFNTIELDNTDEFDNKWLEHCKNTHKKYHVCLPKYYEQNGYVNTYVLVDMLSKLSNEEDVIVPSSSGSASEIVQQSFKVKRGQRVICSPGLGSMGFAIPHAIGSQFASGKRVICIEGDGSLQHNLSSLELIRRYNLPIKIFILENNEYASIRNTQDAFFDGNHVGCDFKSGVTIPKTEQIANAYGIEYYSIGNQRYMDYMEDTISTVLSDNKPNICVVKVDPNLQTQPKVKARIEKDGTIIPGKFEDMWPYLEEK